MFRSLRFYRLLAVLALGLPLTPHLAAGPAQPLRDFRRIIVADDAGPVSKTAAEELAKYAGQIVERKMEILPASRFSADLPGLSFIVGDGAVARVLGKPFAPWKTEEFAIKTTPQGLALCGDDGAGDAWSAQTPAGSMLAVYTLLEDYLGVHWFWPGEFGEHVPRAPEAGLPAIDLRQTPAFEIRSVQLGYTTYHTRPFHEESRRWARRNRLGWVRPAVFGHSWDGAFELRKGESFRQHPEWFALVNGERRPPQMCTTNPEVISRMVEYVLHGSAAIVNISPSDGGGFCECERCQALDVPGVLAYDHKHVQLSDRIFTYANEIARQVRARDPAKGCGMLAYTFYNRPPLKIPALEPNLYLSFVFQSAAHRDPENLREWRESISGWQKLNAHMVVREGWGNHYYHDLPFLHPQQIIESLSEAQRNGFVAAYGEGTKSFATTAPNYWALTRMMWNPRRPTGQLMPEFYTAAYGPVASEMQAFFETYEHALDANWAKRDRMVDTSGIAYANVIGAWGKFFPREVIEEAEGHLKAAEAKAPAGEYAGRVQFHRFGQDYTRVMLGLLEAYRELAVLGVKMDTFSTVVKERRDAPAERAELLQRAYDLGQQREAMLLAHRDWAGPDEGLYAFTNDAKIRRWHSTVKQELGNTKPSPLTKAALLGAK